MHAYIGWDGFREVRAIRLDSGGLDKMYCIYTKLTPWRDVTSRYSELSLWILNS